MVFLAITSAGLAEAIVLAGNTHPVWCSASAITESEFASRRLPNLTRFGYTLVGSSASSRIADALATIDEHHPNERIWVETPPRPNPSLQPTRYSRLRRPPHAGELKR